jgi:hypothetical protein
VTTIEAMRLASVVTAINVLVASGFSIAAIINPQYLVPAAVPTKAALLLAVLARPRIELGAERESLLQVFDEDPYFGRQPAACRSNRKDWYSPFVRN